MNNLLLSTAAATVLLGTLYPLVLDTIGGPKISVVAPSLNSNFVPLMVPLLIAVPFGSMLGWKRGDLAGVAARLLSAFAVTVAAADRGDDRDARDHRDRGRRAGEALLVPAHLTKVNARGEHALGAEAAHVVDAWTAPPLPRTPWLRVGGARAQRDAREHRRAREDHSHRANA